MLGWLAVALLLLEVPRGSGQPPPTTDKPFSVASLSGLGSEVVKLLREAALKEGLQGMADLNLDLDLSGLVDKLEGVLEEAKQAADKFLEMLDGPFGAEIENRVMGWFEEAGEQLGEMMGLCSEPTQQGSRRRLLQTENPPNTSNDSAPIEAPKYADCFGCKPPTVLGVVDFGLDFTSGKNNTVQGKYGGGLSLNVGWDFEKERMMMAQGLGLSAIAELSKKKNSPQPPPSTGTGASRKLMDTKTKWKVIDAFREHVSLGLDVYKDAATVGGTGITVSVNYETPIISDFHIIIPTSNPIWCIGGGLEDIAPFFGGLGFGLTGGPVDLYNAVANGNFRKSLKSALEKMKLLTGFGLGLGVGLTVFDSETGGWFTDTSCPSSRREQTLQSDVVGHLVEVVKSMKSGDVTAPFCVGECIPVDSNRSISGIARLGNSPTCDGVEASLWVDRLSFGNVGYVVLKEVGLDGVDDVPGLGLLSQIGIQNTKLAIGVGLSGVTASASGSLYLPTSGDPFVELLGRMGSALVARLSARVGIGGNAALELRVGLPPESGDGNFSLVNQNGSLGLSVFVRAETDPTPSLLFGATLPVRVCVENCGRSEGRRYLFFQGDLYLEISALGQTVNGDLLMDGVWAGALGMPFLHVGDVVLGLGADFKVVPPVPTRLVVGGKVCLGSQENCEHSRQPYVEGRAYVGLSATNPEDNYFVAMVTELTVGNLLGVLSEYATGLKGVSLPGPLMESGLYPFDRSNPACSGVGAATDLPKECHAYLTVSPVKEQRLAFRSGTLVIPKGVAFSGRLNLLGWEIRAEVAVSTRGISIDVEMDPVTLAIGGQNLLRLGGRLDKDNAAVDGARFTVKAGLGALGPEALVRIDGAFSIPLLKSYGECHIVLNNDIFSFQSSISLFAGALETSALVEWNWDMDFFKMALEDIHFTGGLVTLKKVVFNYDKALSHALFHVDISVLYVVGLRATVEVRENVISFGLTLDASIVETTIQGRAEMAATFAESEFDVTVGVRLKEETIQAIGEEVNRIVGAVATTAKTVWEAVKEQAKEIWREVTTIFNTALQGIKKVLGDILEKGVEFLGRVADELRKVPVLGGLVDAGEKLLNGDIGGALKELGSTTGVWGSKVKGKHIARLGRYNDYGCELLQRRWTKCKLRFWVVCCCTQHSGPEYADPDCTQKVARAAEQAQREANEVQRKTRAVEDSEGQNPGLKRIAEGYKIPDPKLDAMTVVIQGGKKVTAPIATKARTRFEVLAGPKSASVRMHTLASTEAQVPVDLDFTSELAYVDSVRQVRERISQHVSDEALSRQGGVEESLKVEAGVVQRDPPKIGEVRTVTVSCASVGDLKVTPPTATADELCRRGLKVVLESMTEVDSAGGGLPVCGAEYFRYTWRARDGCGGVSAAVEQLVVVLPAEPTFTNFPRDVVITTQDSLDAEVLGEPDGDSPCQEDVVVSYDDRPPVPIPGKCGEWVIERVWSIGASRDNCAASEKTTRIQRITVRDRTAPVWVGLPEAEARVPFFESFRDAFAMPVANETGHPDMLALGLVSLPTTLEVEEGPFVFASTALAEENTCRERGLGQRTQTWRVADACGSKREFVRTVIVEHPPANPTNTQVWDASKRQHAIDGGVVQLADRCHAGKRVEVMQKQVDPLDWETGRHDRCAKEEWDAEGCRVLQRKAIGNATLVHSVAPRFAWFPEDRTLYTNESLSPDGLGVPTGAAYCGTPFKIWHRDAQPVQRGCGKWTIERTWKIQPYFEECGVGDDYPDVLTATRVQVLTVVDAFAPHFVAKPASPTMVDFLADYGPGATGLPHVEDIATHPDIAALGLVSYPVTLEYEDTAKFSGDDCTQGVAQVSRTWRARDHCNATATWVQSVVVREPGEGSGFGGASGFQIFSRGDVSLYNVTVASVGSEGDVLAQRTAAGRVVATGGATTMQCQGVVVNFTGAAETITAFSGHMASATGRNMKTGPQHITCSRPEQTSCVVDRWTTPATLKVERTEPEDRYMAPGLKLTGTGLVYNIFTLPFEDWMIPTPPKHLYEDSRTHWRHRRRWNPHRHRKSVLTVSAGGFVIVNVEYHHPPHHLDTLRHTVFEGPSLGAPFTIYNLREECRGFGCYLPHHHGPQLTIHNSTIDGSLVVSDRHTAVSLVESVVNGQLMSAGEHTRVHHTVFECTHFAADKGCHRP